MTNFDWALANGLPSNHVARAALQVGSLIDTKGSRVIDTRESYWHHATGGELPPSDLRLGEMLLVDCGLLVEFEGVLHPSDELVEILEGLPEDALGIIVLKALERSKPSWANFTEIDSGEFDRHVGPMISDAERREELLLALGLKFDAEFQTLIGELGEQAVVEHARSELVGMGHAELARKVRRVSLQSDQLGYDVVAPRVQGPRRLLEVKTSVTGDEVTFRCFLSRNEALVAEKYADWALVACRMRDRQKEEVEVLGWFPFDAIVPTLPVDSPCGRWQTAALSLPLQAIIPGLPRPIA